MHALTRRSHLQRMAAASPADSLRPVLHSAGFSPTGHEQPRVVGAVCAYCLGSLAVYASLPTTQTSMPAASAL